MASKGDKKATKPPTQEEVLSGFQQIRQAQRNIATKLSELEMEQSEHKMVIETLKNVNDDRKCYRLIGGILTERQVKDVLPILVSNKEKLGQVIEKLNEDLAKKGQELNEYKEKHNIRIRGQDDIEAKEEAASDSRGNVLVS